MWNKHETVTHQSEEDDETFDGPCECLLGCSYLAAKIHLQRTGSGIYELRQCV